MRRSPTPSLRARPVIERAVAALAAVLCALALLPGFTEPAAAGGAVFQFNGGGFGHGVGMSQYGARGQGDAGRNHAEILGSYYPGTTLTTLSPPGPTVLLAPSNCSGVAAAPSTTITPVGGSIDIYVGTPNGLAGITGVPSGSSATVTNAGGGTYQILGPENPGTYAGSFVVIALNGVPTGLSMTGVRYSRGRLVLKANGAALNAYAQDMTMDEYLYGLAEMPSSWPAQTLQAQAIAGRTFAERVAAPRRAGGSDFHIYGSVSDQCYRGYEKEGEGGAGGVGTRWRSAVDATSGAVLLYGGAYAQTFYSSSNGGYSERSDYVFSQTLPYLIAQPDPYDNATGNTLHRWTRTFDGDALGALIGGIGRATSISVTGNIGTSGRINRATVTITGTAGTTTITGKQLQSRLGLPDTLIFSILRDGTTMYGIAANVRPAGGYDAATVSGAQAIVQGWAADPGSNNPVEIDVWVNGTFAGFGSANQYRADVGTAYPAFGNYRGFSFAVPIPAGTSSVCAYAIDANIPQANTPLGCRTVFRNTDTPFGNLDSWTRVPGGAVLNGWAIDPDSTGPIEIHAWSAGQLVGYGTASQPRADVGQAFPAYGPNHGYQVGVSLAAGTHSVCAFGINVPNGNNSAVGCRTVDISPQPLGNLDALVRTGDTVSVQGWALDPDIAGPVEVHVLADGVLAGYGVASTARADIGTAFPYYGPDHGFSFSFPVTPGTHRMCAYAINVGAGVNRSLGCLNV